MQWVKMWGMHRVKLGIQWVKIGIVFRVGDLGRLEWEGDRKWKKMGVVYNLIHR